MIETSLKAKIPTEFDSGFVYCPYIPDIKNITIDDIKFEPKTGYKARMNKVGHEFYVIMVKRRDTQVYCDLAKTNQVIYLTYEDALDDFNQSEHFKEYYHIVKMIAKLAKDEND